MTTFRRGEVLIPNRPVIKKFLGGSSRSYDNIAITSSMVDVLKMMLKSNNEDVRVKVRNIKHTVNSNPKHILKLDPCVQGIFPLMSINPWSWPTDFFKKQTKTGKKKELNSKWNEVR